MKISQVIGLLLILFFPFLSEAQKIVDYQFGNPHASFKMEEGSFFKYPKNNKILSAKIKGKTLYLQLFDTQKLEQIAQTTYNDFPTNFVFEGIFDFQDKFYCFYSLWDAKEKIEQLFVREIDFETASFKNLGQRIVSHQGKISGTFSTGKLGLRNNSWKSFWAIGVFNKFSISFSKERTRLLIQYKLANKTSPLDEKSHLYQDQLVFLIFDKNMKELENKKVKMPYYIHQIEVVELYINDNNAISILAKIYPGIGKPVVSDYNPPRQYHYELFKVDLELGRMHPRKIHTPKKDVKLMQFGLFENINNEIIIAGSYTTDKEYEYTEGFYVFTLKDNGKIDKQFYEIPTTIIEESNDIKTKEEAEQFNQYETNDQLRRLFFNKIILHEDGSLLVVGEQFRSFFNQWENERFHGDLLVARIAPNGELKWMKRLHKYQKNATYKHLDLGENQYFVFQGHPTFTSFSKEAINKMGYKLKEKKLNLLLFYKVKLETGEVELSSVFDIKKANSTFKLENYQANLISPISNHEFIIEYDIPGNKSILVKVADK